MVCKWYVNGKWYINVTGMANIKEWSAEEHHVTRLHENINP